MKFFSWKTASELPLKEIDLLDGFNFFKEGKTTGIVSLLTYKVNFFQAGLFAVLYLL